MKTVEIKNGSLKGKKITIEGLWQDIVGQSWMFSDGNSACLQYAIRASVDDLPIDDDVWYGKIGGLGYLVHESEVVMSNENR